MATDNSIRNRREFLRVAGAAGAYAMTGGAIGLGGQAVRREVTIGGSRVRVIDAHAHCVIPVQDVVKGTPLEKLGGGGGNNLLGPERLQIMDQQGVDVQALTINNFWWYAADVDLCPRDCAGAERGTGQVGGRASRSICRDRDPSHCSIRSWPPSSCRMA